MDVTTGASEKRGMGGDENSNNCQREVQHTLGSYLEYFLARELCRDDQKQQIVYVAIWPGEKYFHRPPSSHRSQPLIHSHRWSSLSHQKGKWGSPMKKNNHLTTLHLSLPCLGSITKNLPIPSPFVYSFSSVKQLSPWFK